MSEELQEIKYYELMNYKDSKAAIKSNINQTARSFVAIGYYLKHIRDKKMYQEDGYENIWDLAQVEFGISKSQASKFMNINDKFSKDGNSPILLEKYKEFSSSKLSEMLYLTDQQLEQVTVGTTVAQIREIKNPEKVVSTSKQEPEVIKPSYLKCASYDFNKFGKGCTECFYDKAENNCPYDRTEYFAEIKRQEELKTRCEVLKEMCDSLCKMRSYFLEKDNYSMETIKSISRGDQSFSFGFGDDGTGHSKYDARFMTRENRYCTKEFHGKGMWIFEAGEVDQQIWNVNGNTWRFKQYEAKKSSKSIDDLEFTVRTYNCLKRAGIDTVEELCALTEIEVVEIRNISQKSIDEIKLKLSEIGKELKTDIPEVVNDEPDNVDNDPEIVNDVDESVIKTSESVIKEPESVIETVEADIVQTVPEELPKPLFSAKYHLQEAIKSEEEQLEVMRDFWKTNQPDTLLKHETILLALKLHLTDMEYPNPEPVKPVQPELPILKNNDQRKEWAENYKAWGEWYYDEKIDCHYYKYEFSNGDRLVVEEYLDREPYWGNDKRDEQYYHFLQKNRQKYEKNKTYEKKYSHDTASMTEIVEYLKDLQKKGA